MLAERRALLQRVLWSPQIAKSPRIREFLEYVCERALQEPSAEIHEREIGRSVFGRGAEYDTSADNVVRVTASQARKKLHEYFSSQGSTEPWIFEIPTGGYTPVFHERDLAADTAVPMTSELDASPSLRALWSQLLPRGGRTDVVVADSSLSLFQESLSLFQERHPRQLTLAEYLQPDLWTRGDFSFANHDLQSFVERMVQRRLTSIGSVTTAFRVVELAGSAQARVFVISPRDFNIRQMKTDNVVLVGSSIANPWVSLFEDRLNFRIGFDRLARFAYFENRDPRPGEPRMYRTDSDVSYCQIAFLPNLAHTGNILAICGAEVEGTEGGGEFITSEHSLGQLRSFAKLDNSGRLPYFEVMLKSNKVGGSTPGFAPVAFRVLPAEVNPQGENGPELAPAF
jgi:hypothetical protein